MQGEGTDYFYICTRDWCHTSALYIVTKITLATLNDCSFSTTKLLRTTSFLVQTDSWRTVVLYTPAGSCSLLLSIPMPLWSPL